MIKQQKFWILGISMSDHNGSVCLLYGDEIIVAIQEERLTRKKRDCLRMPRPLGIDYCLQHAGISDKDLDLVVGCGVTSKKSIAFILKKIFPSTAIRVIPHHLGHAVGAFATSGFYDASILIVDGAGSAEIDLPHEELIDVKEANVPASLERREIISLYTASGTKLECVEKHLGTWSRSLEFGSIGDLYETTASVIFGHNEAGKVMGLAPYGLVDQASEDFFEIVNGKFIFKKYLFPNEDRWPNNQKIYQNLAASVQAATEKALFYLVQQLKNKTTSQNLILSGGVALNSVANEKIIQQNIFQAVYLMPAAEDSGNSIGAAYYGLWELTKKNTQRCLVHDAVGKHYFSKEIDRAVRKTPKVKQFHFSTSKELIAKVVDLIEEQKIIGWFQGGSELGPRALGQRSIICDPRSETAKDYINLKVKHREYFRPFAPAVLAEEANKWFELDSNSQDSPFMLRVAKFRDDKSQFVPAVVHCDGTGRLQTLTIDRNGMFYEVVVEFFRRTGIPILLNTSFNVMHEPIVETPEDALWCLLYTDLDYCVFHDRIICKSEEYTSLLELYPSIISFSSNPIHYKKDGFLGEYFKNSSVYFSVKNCWGNFSSEVDQQILFLLEFIDGKTLADKY
jgi:carbamoyltransferase